MVGERREPSQAQNTEAGVYWQQTYLASSSKPIFTEIAELECQIFQDKRENSFDQAYYRAKLSHILASTHTHTHTHIHTHPHTHMPAHAYTHACTQFRVFCRLCGAPSAVHVWNWFPPGFVVFVVRLVYQSYFRFRLLLVFIGYFPFWTLIGDLW